MIAAVVIDTNVYSGFRRGVADCVEVFSRVPRLIVPLVVVAELLAGFEGSRKAQANRSELDLFLSSSRVTPHLPDLRTAQFYARVYQQLRALGQPIPTNDIWVAASALQMNAPLISADAHFAQVPHLRTARDLSALQAGAHGR